MATLSWSSGRHRFGRLFRRHGVLAGFSILFSSQALAGYVTGVGSVFGYPPVRPYPDPEPLTCSVTVDNGPASCDVTDRSFPYASFVRSTGSAYMDSQGFHLMSTAQVISNNASMLMVNADFWLNDHLTFTGAYPATAMVALTVTSFGTFSSPYAAAGTSFEIDVPGGGTCLNLTSGSCTLQGLFSPGAGLDLDLTMDARALAGVMGSPLTAVPYSSGVYTSYVSSLAFYDLSGNPLALNFSSSSGVAYPGASIAAVPEPSLTLLMILGLAGLGAAHRRRRTPAPMPR